MTSLEDALIRSTLMSERIRHRTDQVLRKLVESFTVSLVFSPLEELMISEQAWKLIIDSGVDPKLVFAHPALLKEHPQTSQYYRGIALLPRETSGRHRSTGFLMGRRDSQISY